MLSSQLPDRILAKLNETETQCWRWTGYHGVQGYGIIRRNGKMLRAHRFIYELLIGPIPEGLQLDHLCRVRDCCNPSHLEPVTSKINILRGEGISAHNARKVYCCNGHELTLETVYTSQLPYRVCKQCNRESATRHQLENREEARQHKREYYYRQKQKQQEKLKMIRQTAMEQIKEWQERNPLRAWRKGRGYSIRDVASALSVSANALQDWEKALYVPREDMLGALARLTENDQIAEQWAEWLSDHPLRKEE